MDLISVARMCHRQTETIRKRRHRSGDGSGWTKMGLLTAVLIGVLLQCDFQQAADWLLGRRRNRVSWQQPLAKPELVVVLEQLFLSMSVEEVFDLEDAETSPLGAAQYRLAVEWAHDRKLASWVRSKNEECGTPVRTAAMAIKMRELSLARGDQPPLHFGPHSPNSMKCWAYRWRRRNGCRISALRKSEPASPEEALTKATPLSFTSGLLADTDGLTRPMTMHAHLRFRRWKRFPGAVSDPPPKVLQSIHFY